MCLMCPWEELSSGSSKVSILVLLQVYLCVTQMKRFFVVVFFLITTSGILMIIIDIVDKIIFVLTIWSIMKK